MKTFLKKIIHRIGYESTSTQAPLNGNPTGILKFGPYEIECHSQPQLNGYATFPDSNRFLGRLAGCVGNSDSALGIVDVGANCGDTAAIMRSQTKLPILCVEGDSRLFSLLQKNSQQCPGLTLVNSYVGEVSGPASVKIEKEGWNNTLVPQEASGSVIQIIRLDQLSHPWLNARKIGLLKVDTEGFDVPILFGAKRLLEESEPVVAFEYNRDNMDAISEPGLRIFPYFASLGYEKILIYDNYGRYFLTTSVHDLQLLTELDCFIRKANCGIFYFDMVAFPKAKSALFQQFKEAEVAHAQSQNFQHRSPE